MNWDPAIYRAKILVLAENLANQSLVERTLQKAGYAHVGKASGPEETRELWASFEPDLIVLDLQNDSFDWLARLCAEKHCDRPALIAAIGECDSKARERAARLEAVDVLRKPLDGSEIVIRTGNVLHAAQLRNKLAHTEDEIEAKVVERTKELYEAQIEILQRLGRASEYRDDDTGDHTKRVGLMAEKIAEALGLPPAEVELISLAAPLHDIGKIAIRDAILMKPGKLTESEYTVMKTHVMLGSRILEGGRSPLLLMAEVIARAHHERWDGSGYPSRLAGEEIPLPGRIVAVADVFDALTSERAYKAAWPVQKAIEEIVAQSGRHFDPAIVEAFLVVMAQEPELAQAA